MAFNMFDYMAEKENEGIPASEDRAPVRMTRREMKEIQEEFHRQKQAYEKRTGKLMSEEMKKSLSRLH